MTNDSNAATDPTWLIPENLPAHADAPDCPMRDSVFALANGRFGCKGARPGSARGRQGTFVAGLFDDISDYGAEYGITDHRWIWPCAPSLFFSAFGEQALLPAEQLPRTLDMRDGILRCEGLVDIDGSEWNLSMARFTSWADKRVAIERLILRPVGHDRSLTVTLGIDETCLSRRGPVHFSGWGEQTFSCDNELLLYNARTRGSGRALSVAVAVLVDGKALRPDEYEGYQCFRLSVKGPTIIDRIVALESDVHDPSPTRAAIDALRPLDAESFEQHLDRHRKEVSAFWVRADIGIDGPTYDQQAVRFCLFALGSAMVDTDQYSYGPKLLAGQHYWGVVFWDTDVFIMPWLTRVFPEKARLHLDFRYRGLAAAREKARTSGFRGAMYPWNAAHDGSESNLGVYGQREVHITADVAWALIDYVDWTGNQAYMNEKGSEILAECARFWESRIDPSTGGILGVCGPDEWATNVDNDLFTNYMSRWVLCQAADRCGEKVTQAERQSWLDAAGRIPAAKVRDDVHEKSDGYFALPLLEKKSSLKHSDRGYSLLKQADIMVLPFMLPHEFDRTFIEANFRFYAPRTVHHSSLSLAPNAVAAALVGETETAHEFLVRAASTDLRNKWPTDDGGLHAAASASVAGAIMRGFAGMRKDSSEVTLKASLPASWRSVSIPFVIGDTIHRVHLRDGESHCVAIRPQ